jgi:hypothetical protein
MRSALDSTLPWWIAGPIFGLVIVSLLALANKRFGIVGGVTDLVQGSSEGRGLASWRTLLVLGNVLGGLAYAVLAGWPDAGRSYSWLDRASLAWRRTPAALRRRLVDRRRRPRRGRLYLRPRPDRDGASLAGEHRLDRVDHGECDRNHVFARSGDFEMTLRLSALFLGVVTGFVISWARMTDPATFHEMLSLESPRIYLLMGATVATAFVGARLLRGHRALLTGKPIDWTATRPTRSHIVGSVRGGPVSGFHEQGGV